MEADLLRVFERIERLTFHRMSALHDSDVADPEQVAFAEDVHDLATRQRELAEDMQDELDDALLRDLLAEIETEHESARLTTPSPSIE